MKNLTFIPALAFALCANAVLSQNLQNAQALSASAHKKFVPSTLDQKKLTNPVLNSSAKRYISFRAINDNEIPEKKNTATEAVLVKVFPNSFANDLQISIKDNASPETFYEAILFDLQGRKIFSQELDSKNETLNLSSFASGVYILHVLKNGHEILREKVLKQ
jgi:hypothetical protein